MTTPTPQPRAYKNFTPKMGVYAVRLPGGPLLNWSTHLDASLNRLRFELDAGLQPNAELQKAWKAGGPQALPFEVLDELAPDPSKPPGHDYSTELIELEALWRERLNLLPRPRNAKGLR